MSAPAAGSSLFGTFLSYQERNADAFYGRTDNVARLDKLLTEPAHLIVLSGPGGVGKTSLLRAGLTHVLARRELTVVTLTTYRDLERELVRATSVVGIAPPVPGQDTADYLGGVAREAKGGLVLILDNLEEVLERRGKTPPAEGAATVAEIALRVVEEAPRTRVVMAIDDVALARLGAITDGLIGPSGKLGVPATMTLAPLAETAVADILERTAVQSGTPFEAGLAAAVAADLVADGPCRPFDLQLTARAIVDLRLASLRRYRRSGGPGVLPALWLADVCAAAGGSLARRALLAASESGGVSESDLGVPTRRGRNRGAETLAALQARGLLVAHTRGRIHLGDLTLANGWTGYAAYAMSKLASVMHAISLAEKHAATALVAYAVHPGVIETKLLHQGFGPVAGATPELGARGVVRLASELAVTSPSGSYFNEGVAAQPAPAARDATMRTALWDAALRLTRQ